MGERKLEKKERIFRYLVKKKKEFCVDEIIMNIF